MLRLEDDFKDLSGAKAILPIFLKKIPKHCGECPIYKKNIEVDDEPDWGDGIYHGCVYSVDTFGCLVDRPKDCPLVIK